MENMFDDADKLVPTNAGGVICASVEYHGGTQSQALQTIEEKIRANTDEVVANARENGSLPRRAAVQ